MRCHLGVLVSLAVTGLVACAGGGSVPSRDTVPSDVPGDPGTGLDVPADAPADLAPDGDALPVDAPADLPSDLLGDLPGDPGTDTGPRPYLSARAAAKAADLARGDNAWGAVGRAFVLENSRVRFVVQDKGTAVHVGIYGGSLVDADLRRTLASEGNDQFRELFPVVGLRTVAPDTVEVVKDGSDGDEAILRVSGPDAPLGVVPLSGVQAPALGVTIVTDYILRPDEPVLRLRTSVVNAPTAGAIPGVVAGDYLAMGGALAPFTAEGGFTDHPSAAVALVGTGAGIAYAYAQSAGQVDLAAAEFGGTLTTLAGSMTVPAQGGRATYERVLAVGTDVASVLDEVRRLRNEPVRVLTGLVTDSFDGAPVLDARVTAFLPGRADPAQGGHAVNQARVATAGNTEGAFRMTLPAGRYDVVVDAPGRARVVKTVDLTAADATADTVLSRRGILGIAVQERTTDGTLLGPIPAKVSLRCLEGTEGPRAELGDRVPAGLCAVLYNPTGEAVEYPLVPGRYHLTLSRGAEYEIYTDEEVVVEEGLSRWVEPALHRSVRTPGFLSGDFHQHTVGTLDGGPTHRARLVQDAAEGVEVAATTDRDLPTSFTPALDALELWSQVMAWDGHEVRVPGSARFSVFTPQGFVLLQDRVPGDLFPFVGAQLHAGKDMADVLAAAGTIPGVDLVVLATPRTGDAYLTWLGYDPVKGQAGVTGRTLHEGFGALEVNGSLGEPADFLASSDAVMTQLAKNSPAKVPVLRDWFSLVSRGYVPAAVASPGALGTSDAVGWPRTWVRVGKDKPDDGSPALVTKALKDGKAVAGNGIFLRLLADGKDRMGLTELVVPEDPDVLALQLVVEAPAWIDVDRLEFYANGRPLPVWQVGQELHQNNLAAPGEGLVVELPLQGGAPSPSIRVDRRLLLFPQDAQGQPKDTWYVVVARGDQDLAPAGSGKPYGYTNPVFVDVDGDGFEF